MDQKPETKSDRILIINGPNLNWVGTREPEVYGSQSLEEYLKMYSKELAASGQLLVAEQSNLEGEIINHLQAAEQDPKTIGVIINAGGYSHTSVAIADTVRAMSKKVIAVHISNTFNRELERHKDLVAAASDGFIGGFGLEGYRLALQIFNNA